MGSWRGGLEGAGGCSWVWAVAVLALVHSCGGGGSFQGCGSEAGPVRSPPPQHGLAIQLRGGARGGGVRDLEEEHCVPGPATLADWIEPVFKEDRKRGKRRQPGDDDDDQQSRHRSAGDAFDSLHRKDDKGRRKDRSDRATVEQVLDPRTKGTLMRMLKGGKLLSVHGCLSTGKEANVYYGIAPANDTDSTEEAHAPNQSCATTDCIQDAVGTHSVQQLTSGLSKLALESSNTTRESLFSEESSEDAAWGDDAAGRDDLFGDRQGMFRGSGGTAEDNPIVNGTRSCEVAIKIFKTSILVFKDRDKYINGDYRFRHGYSKNPRKMVRMWAEKEYRNLRRLWTAGIRCPRPILCRTHILVMEFVGTGGDAAPKLRDALPEDGDWTKLFHEAAMLLRALFHRCNLVHGDLSEYNILFHEGHLTVIDVSQAVQPDHPMALEFLRRDISNIATFFQRKGCAVPSLRSFFDIIIREGLEDARALELLQQRGKQEDDKDGPAFAQDAVFMGSHIPTALAELEDPEFEMKRLAQGSASGQLDNYGLLRGMDMEAARKTATTAQEMADQAEKEELMRMGANGAAGSRISAGKLKASDILANMGLNAFGAPAVTSGTGPADTPKKANVAGPVARTLATSTSAAVSTAARSEHAKEKPERRRLGLVNNTARASFNSERRQDNRTYADLVKAWMNDTEQPPSASDTDEQSESIPDEDIPEPVNWGEWCGPDGDDGGDWAPAPRLAPEARASEDRADGWSAQQGILPGFSKFGWGGDGVGFAESQASSDEGLLSSETGQGDAFDSGPRDVALDGAKAALAQGGGDGLFESRDEQADGSDSALDGDSDDADSSVDASQGGAEGDWENKTWVPEGEWNNQTKDSRNGLSKAEWKQRVKEEKRQKRSTKLKKHLKKRAVARSAARKG